MMVTALLLFSAGFVSGLGTWWFSLDRRRGKEARKLAGVHHLYADTVHDAYVRALRYGFAEDFTFLVRKAHPGVGGKNVSARQPQWSIDGKEAPSFVEED
jgi:hypothetical protein